jgi:hypothetical protein
VLSNDDWGLPMSPQPESIPCQMVTLRGEIFAVTVNGPVVRTGGGGAMICNYNGTAVYLCESHGILPTPFAAHDDTGIGIVGSVLTLWSLVTGDIMFTHQLTTLPHIVACTASLVGWADHTTVTWGSWVDCLVAPALNHKTTSVNTIRSVGRNLQVTTSVELAELTNNTWRTLCPTTANYALYQHGIIMHVHSDRVVCVTPISTHTIPITDVVDVCILSRHVCLLVLARMIVATVDLTATDITTLPANVLQIPSVTPTSHPRIYIKECGGEHFHIVDLHHHCGRQLPAVYT